MKQLTIITDLDDVLENLCQVWVKVLNAAFNRDVKYDEISQWDFTEIYPGIEPSLLYEFLEKEAFWKQVKPLKDAEEITKKLISEGHQIYVATASTLVSTLHKSRFILNNFYGHIPEKNLIVIHNKSLLRGDVIIDDNPQNFGGDFQTKILFSAPHNRPFNAAENGLLRADGWRTVYKIIHEVSGQW